MAASLFAGNKVTGLFVVGPNDESKILLIRCDNLKIFH